MMDSNKTGTNAKVKDLIFAYERQSSLKEPLNESFTRPRAKSIGNVLSYKLFRQPKVEIDNILDIEKELVKIEAHLNYYEHYNKETHVAFQEQLFTVLTSIVRIDSQGDEETKQKKKDLISETTKLAQVLNSKLPFDGSSPYRGLKRIVPTGVIQEEAIVTSTVKSLGRRTEQSTENSLLNRFQSEESLNSTKDSVNSPVKHQASFQEYSQLEHGPNSAIPPPEKKLVDDVDFSYIPSVSRLRKFFSFRRELKPAAERGVTLGDHSGLSRSESVNFKINYTPFKKRDKRAEEKGRITGENGIEDRGNHMSGSSLELGKNELEDKSTDLASLDENGDVELAREPEEYRKEQGESKHNTSVSKLKSLFEQKTKETHQGNYMNHTGLLTNVDISMRNELSKSKSLSDLKNQDSGYEVRNTHVDEYLDDGDDYDRKVSTDLNTRSTANNDNIHDQVSAEDENMPNKTIPKDEQTMMSMSGNVEILKKAFENLNEGTSEIAHKKILDEEQEQLWETPVQVRSNLANSIISYTEEQRGNEPEMSCEGKVENQETTALLMPISSRKNFVNINNSNVEENVLEDIAEEEDRIKKPIYNANEIMTVPGTVETIKKTFSNKNDQEEIKSQKVETETEAKQGSMSILESPTSFSTLVSSSSSPIISLSAQESLSYAETLEDPVSYLILSQNNTDESTEEHTLTISETEEDKPNFSLNNSQETIIDEIIKDNSIENVDEAFEKLLQENI